MLVFQIERWIEQVMYRTSHESGQFLHKRSQIGTHIDQMRLDVQMDSEFAHKEHYHSRTNNRGQVAYDVKLCQFLVKQL